MFWQKKGIFFYLYTILFIVIFYLFVTLSVVNDSFWWLVGIVPFSIFGYFFNTGKKMFLGKNRIQGNETWFEYAFVRALMFYVLILLIKTLIS